jgi:hypothetical protein
MVWRLFKNLVFYSGYLLIFVVVLYYAWTPRYYFSQPEVFFGQHVYNPYDSAQFANWQRVGILTAPVWYMDVLERLSGSSSYGKLTESVYDTALFFPNQRFASRSRHTYKHGWVNDDVFVLNATKVVWQDYPFIRDIHNKQFRLNLLKKNSDLVYCEPTFFFNDYQPDHPILLQNYDGFMIQDGVKPAIHLWDQALSAGHYTTLLATALPEPDKYLPEKNYRILYVDTEAASIEGALKTGRFFLSTTLAIHKQVHSDYHSRLQYVRFSQDTIFIKTTEPALAISYFGQNGEIKKLDQGTAVSFCRFNKQETYMRTEMVFDDGTRYYLNPFHRYAGSSPKIKNRLEVNYFQTWIVRGVAIIGLFFFSWILFYLKRKMRGYHPPVTESPARVKKDKKPDDKE